MNVPKTKRQRYSPLQRTRSSKARKAKLRKDRGVTSTSEIMDFFGVISNEEAEEMKQIIHQEFEQVVDED